MQEVFEKIIKLIDFEKSLYTRTNKREGLEPYAQEAIGKSYDNANEIVKAVSAEYNNGWASCSERLPEKPKPNPLFENKPLELYLVMERNAEYAFRAFWNGKSFTDGWRELDVIAWQPLPQPYEPKEG